MKSWTCKTLCKLEITQQTKCITSLQGIEDYPGALFISQQIQSSFENPMCDENIQALKVEIKNNHRIPETNFLSWNRTTMSGSYQSPTRLDNFCSINTFWILFKLHASYPRYLNSISFPYIIHRMIFEEYVLSLTTKPIKVIHDGSDIFSNFLSSTP